MKKIKKVLFLLTVIATFASCKGSKETASTPTSAKEAIPFTLEIYQSLSPADLAKVQFYLSDEISMSLQKNTESLTVEGGEIIKRKDASPSEVIFPKGTMGIFVGPVIQQGSYLIMNIKFEQGGSGRVLQFMLSNGHFIFATRADHTVLYDNANYVPTPSSIGTELLVRTDEEFLNDPSKRVVPGVPIGGSTGSTGNTNSSPTANTGSSTANTGTFLPDLSGSVASDTTQNKQTTTNQSGGMGQSNTGTTSTSMTVTVVKVTDSKVTVKWTGAAGLYNVVLTFPNGKIYPYTKTTTTTAGTFTMDNFAPGVYKVAVSGPGGSGSTSFTL